MLRYMPSVAGAIYVKREGEIPGLPARPDRRAQKLCGLPAVTAGIHIWNIELFYMR